MLTETARIEAERIIRICHRFEQAERKHIVMQFSSWDRAKGIFPPGLLLFHEADQDHVLFAVADVMKRMLVMLYGKED